MVSNIKFPSANDYPPPPPQTHLLYSIFHYFTFGITFGCKLNWNISFTNLNRYFMTIVTKQSIQKCSYEISRRHQQISLIRIESYKHLRFQQKQKQQQRKFAQFFHLSVCRSISCRMVHRSQIVAFFNIDFATTKWFSAPFQNVSIIWQNTQIYLTQFTTNNEKKTTTKNQRKIRRNQKKIMGHRSVITANIFFILRITLCDFYLWKSVIHTTHRFRLIFIAFFACAKRGRTQNTAKKRKTEINIFRSTDMHQKRASTTYCIQAQPHILSQTQMPRRVYIFNTLAHSLALSLPLSCSLNNHNTQHTQPSQQMNFCPNWQRMNLCSRSRCRDRVNVYAFSKSQNEISVKSTNQTKKNNNNIYVYIYEN